MSLQTEIKIYDYKKKLICDFTNKYKISEIEEFLNTKTITIKKCFSNDFLKKYEEYSNNDKDWDKVGLDVYVYFDSYMVSGKAIMGVIDNNIKLSMNSTYLSEHEFITPKYKVLLSTTPTSGKFSLSRIDK